MNYTRSLRIGIIGCGNMGGAIVRRLIGRGLPVIVSDADAAKRREMEKRYKAKTTADNTDLAARSDIIILAVKPRDVGDVARGLSDCKGIEKKLIISIAAGVPTGKIERMLGSKTPVVRAMPNMPALVGSGISAVSAGRYAKVSHLKAAKDILSAVGDVLDVEEGLMDAVTAISGSGPAYFFYLIESITEAARELGINEKDAKALAIKTALGSAKVLEETGCEPGDLREKVTSKGGTTEAAFRVFESKGFKDIVKEAIRASRDRARELSGE